MEEDLVSALKEKKIAGAATDVFAKEPAGRDDSVLLQAAEEFREKRAGMEGRLILSPHLAWYASSSLEKLRATVAANVEGWAKGTPQNLVG